MIGAIADDFTGATDIAVAFRRSGLRVVLVLDMDHAVMTADIDVLVVALKTRTIPAAEAISHSLAALRWLRDRGADQFYLKYCSTFDSRSDGNIGPVAEAVQDELGAERLVFVPSSPAHQRTQYMGTLFVGDVPLSESPMRHHPLTPMTDSSIPRVLSQQADRAVALIDHRDVREGAERISSRISEEVENGRPLLVVDAIDEGDLRAIGEAVGEDLLVTGAAGLAAGLGQSVARRLGRATCDAESVALRKESLSTAPAAALAGSCSARTLEQIEIARASRPHLFLDALAEPDPQRLAADALAWYDAQSPDSSPLLYSSQPPEDLARTQQILGIDRASAILEEATGLIARGLIDRGVRRLVIAGGETSGAVVGALALTEGQVGREVSPGVPWIFTSAGTPIAVLLKSGNFGDPSMIDRALQEEPS